MRRTSLTLVSISLEACWGISVRNLYINRLLYAYNRSGPWRTSPWQEPPDCQHGNPRHGSAPSCPVRSSSTLKWRCYHSTSTTGSEPVLCSNHGPDRGYRPVYRASSRLCRAEAWRRRCMCQARTGNLSLQPLQPTISVEGMPLFGTCNVTHSTFVNDHLTFSAGNNSIYYSNWVVISTGRLMGVLEKQPILIERWYMR